MAFQLVKKKIYPRVHTKELKFALSMDGSLNQYCTNIPIIMQDEGLGDPNSVYTNPESASFAEYAGPNTYPDSRVNFAKLNLELSLDKGAYTTDNLEVVRVGIIPISMSFLENYTALNDVTSEEVEDILEMQHETTDRQGYPLYDGNKLVGDYLDVGSAVPGLTTNTNIENVALDMNKLYDALQFYTNAGKLRKSIGQIRWLNVSRKRNLRLSIRATSKTKAQNPYTYLGCLIILPRENQYNSMVLGGDATGINHVIVKANYRYNEWNENFNFMR